MAPTARLEDLVTCDAAVGCESRDGERAGFRIAGARLTGSSATSGVDVWYLRDVGRGLRVYGQADRLYLSRAGDTLRSAEARLLYRLPRPTPDGRSVLVLTPLELLDRLARLVPPPRHHRHRYHGVLAPNARLRADVTVMGRPEF